MSESIGIQPEDLAAEMALGTLVVDVREVNELAAGSIPGALCLPLSEFNVRYLELPKNTRLAIYCRSGVRSEAACRALNQVGYDAHNVEGGYQRWCRIQAGRPVQRE